MQDRGIEMVEVKIDVIGILADATAFTDFDRHGAGTRRHARRDPWLTAHSAP